MCTKGHDKGACFSGRASAGASCHKPPLPETEECILLEHLLRVPLWFKHISRIINNNIYTISHILLVKLINHIFAPKTPTHKPRHSSLPLWVRAY